MKNLNEKKIYNQFGAFLINLGITKEVYAVSIKDQL
jgi:hypothetical protein